MDCHRSSPSILQPRLKARRPNQTDAALTADPAGKNPAARQGELAGFAQPALIDITFALMIGASVD
jgi:hypothetical protein